jgi:FkbM family methyltransferase
MEWLWNLLRRPYRWIADVRGKGVPVEVGGAIEVRMPADLSGGSWESYEPESIWAVRHWAQRHPGGLFLDIGSSIGIYSAVALFADESANVVAFDADLPSLEVAERMCRHAAGTRLRLVHGFVSDETSESMSLTSAVARTRASINGLDLAKRSGATKYASLADESSKDIPRMRLSDLMREVADSVPTLVKCDVEGAELFVLRGGAEFLKRSRACLLVSVHPAELEAGGHSKDLVREFLENLGYEVRCIARDHEEHWWCERASDVPPPLPERGGAESAKVSRHGAHGKDQGPG